MRKTTLFAFFLAAFTACLYGDHSTMPPAVDMVQNLKYTVVIDPAHGGGDWGVNIRGIMEKEINLKTAKLIKQKLEKAKAGITVYLTRDNDSFVTAADRAGFANSKKASAFISVHCDYSANPAAEGYKVYYSAGENLGPQKNNSEVLDWTKVQLYHIDESMRLAAFISQYLQASLIPETGAAGNNGVNSTVAGKYRKEQSAVLVSLEGADMPAVDIELGNLNNANDASYLKDDKALNAMAYHIKEAVCYFLKEKK
jgi:N-acetylmuramoyl-L-alanine amidase